jgi:hypothetical protein
MLVFERITREFVVDADQHQDPNIFIAGRVDAQKSDRNLSPGTVAPSCSVCGNDISAEAR